MLRDVSFELRRYLYAGALMFGIAFALTVALFLLIQYVYNTDSTAMDNVPEKAQNE